MSINCFTGSVKSMTEEMTTLQTSEKMFERLPKTVVPHLYSLYLTPDLQNFTFDGVVTINVTVYQRTNTVHLNAVDLIFESVSFSQNGQKTEARGWSINKDTEVATITFLSAMKPGVAQLSISFSGVISDKLNGFYRSRYATPEGEVRYAAITQFESTSARQAFPCWDEPAIKAKFNITLIVPEDRTALSNMRVISVEPDENQLKKVVRFDTTPIMSTYLVAFIVGEYDFVEDATSNGIDIHIYTPVGKKYQAKFALDVAVKTLPFYENYFDIPYPLQKLDLIAISDFESGAMENWGLCTFRETSILFDENNSTLLTKQTIAQTIAHELAHQWFGNLVTMEWWTHLWLNEGFAMFMEYLCISSLFSEYNIWTQFVADETLNTALALDAMHNSHPIEVTVGHPSEVEEIFDAISYKKGASIIRMLYEYVGDECFRRGLSSYLKKHAYKNTVTDDLWEAFETASKKPIAKIMKSWTKQKGFPVILISSRQKGNDRILTLTQEKFCLDAKLSEEEKKALWCVPVSIIRQSSSTGETKNVLLESKQTEVLLKNFRKNEWIKLNSRCVGFYRVQYPSELTSQLISAIKDKSMTDLDRLGVHSDLFAMVQSGKAVTVDLLKVMEAYFYEDNYSVWNSIDSCLEILGTLLSSTTFCDNFNEYGRRLLSRIERKLGWCPKQNESHLDTMLRPKIIRRLVSLKHPETIAESKRRFNDYLNNGIAIPADLKAAVYRAVAMDADDHVFDSLFTLYRFSEFQEEKLRLVMAMTASEDAAKIEKVLEFAMSSEVRTQDTYLVFIEASKNKFGREITWRFFKQQFEELRRRYEGSPVLSSMIEFVTKNFASEKKAFEIEKFFATRPQVSPRAVQQSLESIILNASWLSRDKEIMKTYLSNFS